jgi:hypothetical protein
MWYAGSIPAPGTIKEIKHLNQALMLSKHHGIGAFSSCVRPFKKPQHIFGVKSILQIKLSRSKNMIGIQKVRRWLILVPCQGEQLVSRRRRPYAQG